MPVVHRRRKQVPGYRLHRPSGQAVVTLSGTDFYLGPYGTQVSRKEYDRAIAEWLANGRRLAVPAAEQNPLTISELLLAYWRHVTGYYVKRGVPTSEQHVIRSALRPVRQLYGSTDAASFSPLALKAVREQYIAAGVARSTVNRYAGHVVRMFRWAVENELVPAATHHALQAVTGLRKGRTPARETGKVRSVSDAFVEAVRPFVSRQVWAMIELQRLTAMRPSEVVSMRACDLELDGDLWIYRPQDHKTEHHELAREVWLGPRAQEVLRPWLQTDLNRLLFSPTDAESERRVKQRHRRRSPMTPSQAARRPSRNRKRPPADCYTACSYRRAIHRACDRAGIPRWSPNRLRHTAATQIRRRHGLDAARVILGHTTAATSEIYAELDRGKALAVVRELG